MAVKNDLIKEYKERIAEDWTVYKDLLPVYRSDMRICRAVINASAKSWRFLPLELSEYCQELLTNRVIADLNLDPLITFAKDTGLYRLKSDDLKIKVLTEIVGRVKFLNIEKKLSGFKMYKFSPDASFLEKLLKESKLRGYRIFWKTICFLWINYRDAEGFNLNDEIANNLFISYEECIAGNTVTENTVNEEYISILSNAGNITENKTLRRAIIAFENAYFGLLSGSYSGAKDSSENVRLYDKDEKLGVAYVEKGVTTDGLNRAAKKLIDSLKPYGLSNVRYVYICSDDDDMYLDVLYSDDEILRYVSLKYGDEKSNAKYHLDENFEDFLRYLMSNISVDIESLFFEVISDGELILKVEVVNNEEE